jgi:hypothetical protein
MRETGQRRIKRLERSAARRADIDAEITDLRYTIEDRRRHGAADPDLLVDDRRLEGLQDQLESYDEYEDEEQEPILGDAPRRSAFDPAADFARALQAELTDDERDHLEALLRGDRQSVIASRLRISQGAVSKRQIRLRQKVNAIHQRVFGRDYSLIDRSRIAGRQGRRRRPME